MAATIILVLFLIISVSINVLLFFRKKDSDNVKKRTIRTTIISGIENVIEVATLRENFQSTVQFSDAKKFLNFNIPGTAKKFMLQYTGTIVYGCDLRKAQVSDPYDNNKVRIILPHSEILDAYANTGSYQVYDQSAGIFTSVKLEDQNREVNANLEEKKAESLQKGLLEHSDENVRKILTSIVAPTGMIPEIIFTDKNSPELGGQPEPIQIEAQVSA